MIEPHTALAGGRAGGGGGDRDLPTPPVGVALVIRAASDPTISLHDLGRLIEKEPTLTVNLLKLSNSAAYSTGREVRSVGQATMLLGARTIRNISVAHAVRAMSERVNTGELDAKLFWEDSLRRACAALVIARQAGYEDPSEAFTVGLIQDLGVLMMAATRPDVSGRLQQLRTEPSQARVLGETNLIGRAHTELFVNMGRGWGLPPDLVDAVAFHHSDVLALPDRRTNRLAHIARAADLIADITQTHASGDVVLRAKAVVGQLEARAKLEVDGLVDATVAEMTAQSKDLEIHIGEQPSYQELMEGANKALVQINVSYEELTQQLEQALREKEELAAQLEKTNEALRRLATTDPLT
ncbi:MAG: HDOD domain-containing protein, partial [Myxococcales bacterium]|nr:HDOD domain-containing protein [Myxococcales bacterium]